MVNLTVFKHLLEAAFGIKVVRFHKKVKKFYSDLNGHEFVHECDILTSEGGLHITLHESHFQDDKFLRAVFKSSINSQSIKTIKNLIMEQLDVEIFLTNREKDGYELVVESK